VDLVFEGAAGGGFADELAFAELGELRGID